MDWAGSKADQHRTLDRNPEKQLNRVAYHPGWKTIPGVRDAPIGGCLARAFIFHAVRQELLESAVPTKK
jgi:hypothetical protein